MYTKEKYQEDLKQMTDRVDVYWVEAVLSVTIHSTTKPQIPMSIIAAGDVATIAASLIEAMKAVPRIAMIIKGAAAVYEANIEDEKGKTAGHWKIDPDGETVG